MADPSHSEPVAQSSTPRDSARSEAPRTTISDYDIPERRRSFIADTEIPRPWEPPQFVPGERDRHHLGPAPATPRTRSSGGGSTIHDLGYGDYYDDREAPPPHAPFYAQSPNESRRSTAELVAQTGTFAGANNVAQSNASIRDSDVASQHQPEEQSLKFETAIRASFIESASKDRKQFLPIDAFTRIVTRERVRSELQRFGIPVNRLDWYTDQVWEMTTLSHSRSHNHKPTSRRKIFAILALIEKVQDIVHFIDENLYDNDLPFLISNGPNPGTRQLERKDRHGKLHPISIVSSWPTYMLEVFNDYQWKLLAPYFTLSTKAKPDIQHFFFDDGIILPFIEDEEIPSGEGGYGEVWKVRIHPAHHNCSDDAASDDDNPPYAVKRLRHSNHAAFKAEVSNLKRFSSKDHLHLIKLLVTFEWRGQYYLLFPCADGNLLNFWQQYPTLEEPQRDRSLALWFSRQCLGLAEGLKMIHTAEFRQGETLDIHPHEQEKIHGRHGDLKPENILWFRAIGAYRPHEMGDGSAHGVLKISDFGLTRFHRTASIFSRLNGKNMAVSPTYRAPEYDIERGIDQSYDIWTLGCVLLEFVAWYLAGWEEVETFSKNRTRDDMSDIKEDVFFNNVDIIQDDGSKKETGARAKRSVANEFERLYNHENCSDFVLDLLDFIETRLMRMGPWKRATCDEIVEKLSHLHDMCKMDSRYCTERVKPAPNRARTNLSLLAASALPYSEEQQRRIHRNTIPEVRQEDNLTGIIAQLDPSPFPAGQDRPSGLYTERTVNAVPGQEPEINNNRSGSRLGDAAAAGPSRQPQSSAIRSPSPMRGTFPSVTVTPSMFGPSHTLIQSPTMEMVSHSFIALPNHNLPDPFTESSQPPVVQRQQPGPPSEQNQADPHVIQTPPRRQPNTQPTTPPESRPTDHDHNSITQSQNQSPRPSNSDTMKGSTSRSTRENDSGSTHTATSISLPRFPKTYMYGTFGGGDGHGARDDASGLDENGSGDGGCFCGGGLFSWVSWPWRGSGAELISESERERARDSDRE